MKERAMKKRIGWVLLGASAMAAVAVATSFGAGATPGPRDAVWGGGHFHAVIGASEFDRDFSVNAGQGRFGSVDNGSFIYGLNSTIDLAPPSCINVQGNEAVIAGVSHAGGVAYAWYAKDNGTPGSATRDEVSAVLLLEQSDVEKLSNFPAVCPTPTEFRTNTEVFGVFGAVPIFSLPYGDVVVRDAP
jgi:hypothetical protein